MHNILILGVNGFTGKHFCNYIKENKLTENYSFTGADLTEKCTRDIKYRKTDLSSYSNIEKLLLSTKPDYIINFAALFKAPTPDILFNMNASLAVKLFDIIIRRKLNIKNILLIGSAAEYGDTNELPLKENFQLKPVNLYGLSKASQTMYAQFYNKNFGIRLNIARTFNVIGTGMPSFLSLPSFIRQIKNADAVNVGNLNTKRDFIDIKDVVDGYWKILIRGKSGEVYNVCSGKSFCMKELLDYLIKKSDRNIKITVKREKLKKNDIKDSYGDNTKLKKDTGWKCRTGIFKSLDNTFKAK